MRITKDKLESVDIEFQKFQGTVSGYISAGQTPVLIDNTIDKFPFAADANATDVGNLSQTRSSIVGQSSAVSGYNTGGTISGTGQNTIDKFPFSTDTNATDVGDLTQTRNESAGQQV